MSATPFVTLASAFVTLAIAFVISAIAFVISAIAFVTLALAFVTLALAFVTSAITFVTLALAFVTLALAFVTLALAFVIKEIGFGRESKLAYQTLLLAIALGLLSQHSQGDYQFNGRSLGKDREQIALALVTEFTFEELYGNLKEHIETFERDFVYHKLQDLGTSASYLNHYEGKLLDHLLSEYNPLN